jgi:formate/nitrite transporter FocA (FNT family)
MTDPVPASRPAIFELNAYNPSEIEETIERIGITKATLALLPGFMLAVVASDATLSFAVARLLGGLVFSLGLAIVLVGGAELFTGNNLIVMAWASRRVSTLALLRNWTIVYAGARDT